jgi:ATP-dependent Clp protease ATP-binding subunit ClpA
MVEPSNELQLVFEKSIDVAKKLNHEYLTLEHLLFAMLCEESFTKCVQGYGSDPEFIKKNLENYLKNKCNDIISTVVDTKPRKTQTVERVLNRAFTQVLFNGRQQIESTDVFIAIMSEKRSFAAYYIQQSNIDKDKFADYLNNEMETI